MAWLRIDDCFGEHEKIIDLSDRSFRLHVVALCYCARNLTDGTLRKRQVAAVCAITGASRRQIHELVSAGLWDEYGKEGFRIRDYLDYNPTAADVKEKKRQRSEAGRIGGRRSGEARAQANAEANASPFASSKRSSTGVEPHPIPSRKTNDGFRDEPPLRAVKTIIDESLGEAQ